MNTIRIPRYFTDWNYVTCRVNLQGRSFLEFSKIYTQKLFFDQLFSILLHWSDHSDFVLLRCAYIKFKNFCELQTYQTIIRYTCLGFYHHWSLTLIIATEGMINISDQWHRKKSITAYISLILLYFLTNPTNGNIYVLPNNILSIGQIIMEIYSLKCESWGMVNFIMIITMFNYTTKVLSSIFQISR